jgi:hypothetical protein
MRMFVPGFRKIARNSGMDALRGDRRFDDLLRRINYPPAPGL